MSPWALRSLDYIDQFSTALKMNNKLSRWSLNWASKQMRKVTAFLHGQVLLWCGRLIFPEAPVGDFVATHAAWVSPRNRQEVTNKCWRAESPTL